MAENTYAPHEGPLSNVGQVTPADTQGLGQVYLPLVPTHSPLARKFGVGLMFALGFTSTG